LGEVLEDDWCWRVLHAGFNLPRRRIPDSVAVEAVDGADAQKQRRVNISKSI
jgi:hypothetical protein